MLILTNPKAGARSGDFAVSSLAAVLEAEGLAVSRDDNIDRLVEQVQTLTAADALHAVIAAGGDGTAALAVNRLPVGTPLAVLPLGTENLLAKYLSLPTDPKQFARIVLERRVVHLDAGLAGERLFLLMVGCGFDADVVRRLHSQRDGHINHFSYAKPILDSIRSYDYPELRIYCRDLSMTEFPATPNIVARWAFVVNLPRYAGGLRLAPQATGSDAQLDICTFKHGSLWNGLMYLSGVALGQHESWRDCTMQRITHVRIEADAEVPYQLDGDPGGVLPVEIKVLPNRLTLIAPRNWREASEA